MFILYIISCKMAKEYVMLSQVVFIEKMKAVLMVNLIL